MTTTPKVFDQADYMERLRKARLYPMHLPNVWAFTYQLPYSESTVTLYRSVPGDTRPRMQIRVHNSWIDDGEVANPERFGTWGTLSEFEQWCRKFKSS